MNRTAGFALIGLGLVLVLLVVPGLVSSLRMATYEGVEGRLERFDAPRRGVRIPVYTYTVDGVVRTGRGTSHGFGSVTAGMLPGIEVGGPITVYVDPSDPTRAAVVRAPHWFSLVMFAGGAGLFAIGVLTVVARSGDSRPEDYSHVY